ncbi:MAG TPA: hypothetical protein VK171_01510 [Fimbriimonas sp.]|nr:hypothetical protein [Fimbriimonas sp.]
MKGLVVLGAVYGGYIVELDGVKKQITVEEHDKLVAKASGKVSDKDAKLADQVTALEAKVTELTDAQAVSTKALEANEEVITNLTEEKEALEAKVTELTERIEQLEAVPPADPPKPSK